MKMKECKKHVIMYASEDCPQCSLDAVFLGTEHLNPLWFLDESKADRVKLCPSCGSESERLPDVFEWTCKKCKCWWKI